MVPKYSLPGACSLKEALALGNSNFNKFPLISLNDIAFLQYTGGTTGFSKGAVLTHRNIASNVAQAFVWLKGKIREGEEIIITALPLYHIFSLTANCLTFMGVGGNNVLIPNPRDIKGFVKTLGKYKFTAITGVNTLFNALLNNDDFKKLDFSPLRVALGGGMAVQNAVAESGKSDWSPSS